MEVRSDTPRNVARSFSLVKEVAFGKKGEIVLLASAPGQQKNEAAQTHEENAGANG